MGQKMDCLGHRGTVRSRQDESKEVGEVGSKRTSSGCNGVHHVVWWGGLIFRLLRGHIRNHIRRTAGPSRRLTSLRQLI
jgi:hypothetical protein